MVQHDLTGLTFGKLTALKDTGKRKNGRAVWLCQCECGNTVEASTHDLTSGRKRSCGCLKSAHPKKDLTGQVFGKLMVLEDTGKKNKRGVTLWQCQCSCGNTVEASTHDLTTGNKRSCGCLKTNFIKKDLTGQVFGKLTVLEDTGKRVKRGYVVWLCQCSCGNQVEVNTQALTSGNTQSCGCTRRKDLTGQVFGKLTVIEDTGKKDKHGITLWLCQCSCGNTVEASTQALTSGSKRSCGCLQRRDLTGKVFGKLTVLEDTGNRNQYGGVLWLCQCSCGNTVEVSTHDLTSGDTRSCGCLRRKNLKIGEVFGRLTVLEDTGRKDKYGSFLWLCQCSCGNTVEVNTHALLSGNKRSCGCLKGHGNVSKSKVENKAPDLLNTNNTSGVTGVSWDKGTASWLVGISVQHRRYILGRYKDKAEAAEIRRKAEQAAHSTGHFSEWYRQFKENK